MTNPTAPSYIINLSSEDGEKLKRAIAEKLYYFDKFYLLQRTKDLFVKLAESWGVDTKYFRHSIDLEAYLYQYFLLDSDATRPVYVEGVNAYTFSHEIFPTLLIECLDDMNLLEKSGLDHLKPTLSRERKDIYQALSQEGYVAAMRLPEPS